MGYKEWACAHIINKNNDVTYHITNTRTGLWGKFYKSGDQNVEIEPTDIDNIAIKPKGQAEVWSCGRENAWSGTEVQFDIYDGNTQVCSLYYTCPYSGSNLVTTQELNTDYMVQVNNVNMGSGALGRFDVSLFKMPS